MPQHGKKYLEVAKMVDPLKLYQPAEAIELIKQTSYAKFDATVEVHMRLGVDPRHADQMVRGVAILPAGTGKTVRVLVFAQGDKAREAEEAGADFVGSDDLIKRIEDGWLGFDTAIATPDMMGKVSRLGRILGPRGLMPNPRTGTVSFELERVIKEVKAGRVEFRVERTVGVIHAPVGKVSFTDEQLRTNLAAFMDAIVKARPSGAKGAYVRSINLSTTMGPGLKLDVQPTLALAGSAA